MAEPVAGFGRLPGRPWPGGTLLPRAAVGGPGRCWHAACYLPHTMKEPVRSAEIDDSRTRFSRRAVPAWLLPAIAACCLLGASGPLGAEQELPVKLRVGTPDAAAVSEAALPIAADASFLQLHVVAPTSWPSVQSLAFDVYWPEDPSTTNAQILAHMMDRDYLWYQKLLPGYLRPGEWNRCRIDLGPETRSWTPQGHKAAWHYRALVDPREFGIRIFYKQPVDGTCRVARVSARIGHDESPPAIRRVRPNAQQIGRYEKFEVTFALPDRYEDPFDPDQVAVLAAFETPGGETVLVDGYYGRDFYRTLTETGERTVPQGPPYWRVRFAPTELGRYRYTLNVRDAYGEATWGPSAFTAVESDNPGFVRVSEADRRFFGFDDGSYFFPIGHNTRSAFDTRMDEQFPWRQRWPEGTAAYMRFFRSMAENGENLAEVWTASWSLGLEWTADWPWYRGMGQYNMRNAWELDRVMEAASQRGIYLNLVIHNHGKFSTYSDEEWAHNPFNVDNGGYLDRPEEYFTDARALKSFRKLMRYMIARWGYSSQIFAWELWSELDLTGSRFGRNHRRPEVTDWHRLMGRAIKDMDPNDHMISTHVCGDYTHQSEDIISLPEIDLCPVNAYHHSRNPLQLVNLLRRTVAYNRSFNKPVLVTEFGGSHMAEGIKHLREGLHAGLWASACMPLGGTPLFWWWQVIEEENFYPKYAALARFMQGEDRRDPEFRSERPVLLVNDTTTSLLDGQCLKSDTRVLGWIYRAQDFPDVDPTGKPTVEDLTLRLDEMEEGSYVVEFWDTMTGRMLETRDAAVEEGELEVATPPLVRDMAFKVKPSAGR